ncbi:MAG: hypothetical protein GXO61_02255 [Epsilonproteobacteria bacterium]|nr:hypothetical protein [Campylobacterota bacterium]
MKRLTFLIGFVVAFSWGAMLSTDGTQPNFSIEAKVFKDDCLIVEVKGKVVGTQDDGNGTDDVEFLVYDDGKVILKKVFHFPINEAVEVEDQIIYKGKISQNSPGVAVESQELGIYIDPLIPTKIPLTCQEYFISQRVEKEYKEVCLDLEKFGFKCGGGEE